MHRSRVAHVQFLAMFQEQLLDLKRVQAWLAKRDAAASSAAVSASMDATPWDESATGSLLEVGVRARVCACVCVRVHVLLGMLTPMPCFVEREDTDRQEGRQARVHAAATPSVRLLHVTQSHRRLQVM